MNIVYSRLQEAVSRNILHISVFEPFYDQLTNTKLELLIHVYQYSLLFCSVQLLAKNKNVNKTSKRKQIYFIRQRIIPIDIYLQILDYYT